jgi:hypothetical protein
MLFLLNCGDICPDLTGRIIVLSFIDKSIGQFDFLIISLTPCFSLPFVFLAFLFGSLLRFPVTPAITAGYPNLKRKK